MRSITIHKLDDDVGDKIEQIARKNGMSLNQAIKGLLREAVGLEDAASAKKRKEFSDLFGTWSEKEAADFAERVREFDNVDEGEW